MVATSELVANLGGPAMWVGSLATTRLASFMVKMKTLLEPLLSSRILRRMQNPGTTACPFGEAHRSQSGYNDIHALTYHVEATDHRYKSGDQG